MSPLYDDVESKAAGSELESNNTPKKTSFFRKWGPAIVAIAGVIAVNAHLLGPTGHKIPELNSRQLAAKNAREERTQAVLDMEWDHAADLKRGLHNVGSRNLSEEEGGVMEYTRRRHRYLGEYVHVDVSDQFTLFGKLSISARTGPKRSPLRNAPGG